MTTRATPNNIVPIGSSVLHLINSESSSSLPPEAANKSLSSEFPPSRPFTPCLLIAHPTIDGRNKENMFLVNGPSKSGKTSLAMDLACCRAYNHACQCLDPATCDCVSVLYFRLDRSNESNTATTQRQSDDFPLSCHQRQQSLENKSQETQLSSLYSNLEDRTKEEREGHDSSVLRRIKVLYVSSTQEILCELLAILGQQQHACQSIIIDDIDKIAASEPNPTSSIMQACTFLFFIDTFTCSSLSLQLPMLTLFPSFFFVLLSIHSGSGSRYKPRLLPFI